MAPTTPPFPPNVRFATPEDLPRLGLIAVAGYKDAPQFPYVRPYFKQWPGDTVAGFQNGYREELMASKALVVVAEDELDVNEKDKSCVELKDLYPEYRTGDVRKKVAVAVASLDLPESCQWVRQKKNEAALQIPKMDFVRRDVNAEGGRNLGKAVHQCVQLHGKGKAMINTMVLHPAYRGKRHGDALLKWIHDFLSEQGLGYYIPATPAGKKLYVRHGAHESNSVTIPGYSEHPQSFEVYFLQWDPIKY